MKKKLLISVLLGAYSSIVLTGCANSTPVAFYKPTLNNSVLQASSINVENHYAIRPLYGEFGVRKYIITDTKTNQVIKITPKSPGSDIMGAVDDRYYVVGTLGDKIFYIYKGSNGKKILEAYNLKTNETNTLIDDTKQVQFLKNGNQVVLKAFKNQGLSNECDTLNGYHTSLKSKYSNEPATYIDLNTLNEVSGVSSSFKPIFMYSVSENITGAFMKETCVTMNATELYVAQRWNNGKIRKVKTLF